MGDFIIFTNKSKELPFKDITLGKPYEVETYSTGMKYIIDDIGDENSAVMIHSLFYEELTQRPHYDLRIAHANGADIESSMDGGLTWWLNTEPLWREDTLYRVAIPKPPERVFPVTSLTDDELIAIWHNGGNWCVTQYRAIANAAIKRFVEDTENE